MSIRYVGQVGQAFDSLSASSTTFTCSAATAIGQFVILAARSGASTVVSSISDSSSNTWTKLDSSTGANTTAIWYSTIISPLTTSSTITVNYSGSSANHNVGAWAFTGINRPVTTSANANGTAVTTLNTGNLTPSAYASLLLTAVSTAGPNTFTAPSGYTRLPLTTSAIWLAVAYLIRPSTAAAGTTWTWSSSSNAGQTSGTFTPDGGDFLAMF